MTAQFRLSQWQLFIVVYLASFCATPFGFVSLFAKLGRHIWMASLMQLAITLLGTVGVWLLLRQFPYTNLLTVVDTVAGRVPARIYLFLLGTYMMLWGPVGNLFAFRNMTEATLLPTTNPYLITGFMIVIAGFAAYFGPEVIARVTETWGFVVLPGITVVALLPFFNGEPGRLLPLTRGIPERLLYDMDLWSFSIGLRGFILALALAGMSADEHRLGRTLLAASFVAALFVSAFVIVPQTVFPPQATQRFQFPVLEAMDTVDVSVLGIQSFLVITMMLWLVVGWVVVSSTLFAASYLFANTFGLRSHRWILGPLAVLGIMAPAYPFSLQVQHLLFSLWSALGYGVGIVAPWGMLLLGHSFRRRRQSTERSA